MKLWLSLYPDGTTTHGAFVLMQRDFPERETAPYDPEEMVTLWNEGPVSYPKRRYWDHEGVQNCELKGMVFDPKDQPPNVTSSWYHYYSSWFTEVEENGHEYVIEQLLAAGWTRYGG